MWTLLLVSISLDCMSISTRVSQSLITLRRTAFWSLDLAFPLASGAALTEHSVNPRVCLRMSCDKR